MRYEWKTEKPMMEHLIKGISEFFSRRNFKIETQPLERSGKVKIYAIPSKASKFQERIEIELIKTEKGIEVNFVSIERKNKKILNQMLLTFLFGGAILLKEVESKEKLDILQEEFWSYVQSIISNLNN